MGAVRCEQTAAWIAEVNTVFWELHENTEGGSPDLIYIDIKGQGDFSRMEDWGYLDHTGETSNCATEGSELPITGRVPSVASGKGVVEGYPTLVRRLHQRNSKDPDERNSPPFPLPDSLCPFIQRSTFRLAKI